MSTPAEGKKTHSDKAAGGPNFMAFSVCYIGSNPKGEKRYGVLKCLAAANPRVFQLCTKNMDFEECAELVCVLNWSRREFDVATDETDDLQLGQHDDSRGDQR